MIPFQSAITVNRPADEVFRFVADLVENSPKWMGGVSKATPVSQGPTGVGTRFQLAGKSGPWTFDATFEVTELEMNRRLAFKTVTPAGPLHFEGRFVFEPTDASATRLTSSGAYRLLGLWRLAEPLMAGEMRKGEDEELKKIKSIVEANA